MHPSGNKGPKGRSPIPQSVSKTGKKPTSAESSDSQNASGDSLVNYRSSKEPPPAANPPQNPLRATMNKKKTTKKNPMSESWADQKAESQSQKLQAQVETDGTRRKADIERDLMEAEKQIGVMASIIEKRDKWLEETKNAAESKTGELEERMPQEGIMADLAIDPVTGEQISISDGGKKKVEAPKKITKKTVESMREKLREMNRQTESFLADIENTMQYLSSLEDASERTGPFSEETQAMIARLGADEDAISKVYKENIQPSDAENQDEDVAGAAPDDDDDIVALANDKDKYEGGDDEKCANQGRDEESRKSVDNDEGSRFFITNASESETVVT